MGLPTADDQRVKLRVLAEGNSQRGDLFTELVSSLLTALGYAEILLNVNKTGREIDVTAYHPTGGFHLRGECKAEKMPVGAAAVNKFLGVLTRERSQRPDDRIRGLFVSLSGRKDSAKAQEEEAPVPDLLFMDGDDVVDALTKSNLVCSRDHLALVTGRILQQHGLEMKLDTPELVVSRTGLVWIQYLRRGGEIAAAAFVHADGDPLSESLIQELARIDAKDSPRLNGLQFITPLPDTRLRVSSSNALKRYREYLLRECGEIEMTGLSADAQLTTRRYELEKLFVPLRLVLRGAAVADLEAERELQKSPSPVPTPTRRREKHPRLLAGRALSRHNRLMILGDPGSGKSTLLKRIAVAYADPSRRSLVPDHLPDRDWLPIFVRCRQLKGLTIRSITDLMDIVPVVAELRDEAETLAGVFRERIREGTALILIDGLDEIPDAGDRLHFCRRLERFAAQYAACSFLITCRIVGYREMAFKIGQNFSHATLADLQSSDIRKYVNNWHRHVEPSRKVAEEKARGLLEEIFSSTRVVRLAQNPLMLATLTLIRRWVGELPKRRSTLYAEAVQVLLVNWNREAHDPLDLDEALPQLDFLSFWMMQNGFQQLNRSQLIDLLRTARIQMPDVLGNARTSPGEFLSAVEYRSSLLSETGRRLFQGELAPVYEFRHLAFQEYLGARAAVFGHIPSYRPSLTPLDVLKPYVGLAAWREVFPLAAVLAGRQATDLVDHLLTLAHEEFSTISPTTEAHEVCPYELAMLCLADEPSVLPATVDRFLGLTRAALQAHGHFGDAVQRLSESAYGAPFVRRLGNIFVSFRPIAASMVSASMLGRIVGEQLLVSSPPRIREWKENCMRLSASAAPVDFSVAALTAMHIAYSAHTRSSRRSRAPARSALKDADWEELAAWLKQGLHHPRVAVRFATAWALAWILENQLASCEPSVARRLMELAAHEPSKNLARQAGWALTAAVQDQNLLEDLSWAIPPDDHSLARLIRRSKAAIRHRPRGPRDYHDNILLSNIATLCYLWQGRAPKQEILELLSAHLTRCDSDIVRHTVDIMLAGVVRSPVPGFPSTRPPPSRLALRRRTTPS